MPEPTPGPAPELNSPQGTQLPQQLSQQPPPESGQLPNPEATPQPSVEELQRRAETAEQRTRDTQAAFTQGQQELARLRQITQQLVGNQVQPPPQNPVDQYAQHFVAKGYGEKAAKDSAELVYGIIQNELAPIRQQAQIATRFANVDNAIQQAMNIDPQMITTQQDWNTAREAAAAHIQNGGSPDPYLMLSIVNDAKYRARLQNPPASQPPAAMQPQYQQPATVGPQPFANGMFRVTPGFTPPIYQNQPQGLTADQQSAQDFILKRTSKK